MNVRSIIVVSKTDSREYTTIHQYFLIFWHACTFEVDEQTEIFLIRNLRLHIAFCRTDFRENWIEGHHKNCHVSSPADKCID